MERNDEMTDSLQRIVAELRSESAYVGERLNARLKVWADRLERLSAAEQKVTVDEFDLLNDVVLCVKRAGYGVRDSYTTRFNHLRNPPIPCIELHIVIAESEFEPGTACAYQKSDVGGDGKETK